MERLIGGGLLLFFGVGLAVYAARAWAAGEVRAGADFLRGAYSANRDESPAQFHAFALLYALGGIGLTIWGVLILLGLAAPVALR